MYENDNEPVGQRLRCVTLLDVTPGHAREADVGQPIGILSFSYKDELEQGMMLTMADVRRLAIGCLVVTAHHEGGIAEEIVRQYLLTPDGTASFSALDPKTTTSAPEPTAAPTKPEPLRTIEPLFMIQMIFNDPSITPVQLGVISGFRHRRTTLLACRCDTLGEPSLSLACLGPHRSISMLSGVATGILTASVKMVTTSLDIDGQTYRRLRHEELKRAVGKAVFTFCPQLPPKLPPKRSHK